MVFRRYSVAKGIGTLVAFIIVIFLLSVVVVPLVEKASTGAHFAFPSSSTMSNASGVNKTYEEQGSPRQGDPSTLTYSVGVTSLEYVYYNSTSYGFYEVTEMKTSSTNASISIYSSYNQHFHSLTRNSTGSSMTSNISAAGFLYFYASFTSGLFPHDVSAGYDGIYVFLMYYVGSMDISMNNSAQAVILQMY